MPRHLGWRLVALLLLGAAGALALTNPVRLGPVATGLGAVFILAALFLLGGDSLTDFALALLIGIVVGTWSSVLVATPLLVAFEGRRHFHQVADLGRTWTFEVT